MSPRFDDVAVGTALPPLELPVRRIALVRYAGASGDFNPLHWSDRAAWAAGLPGVVAHGLFTMASVARLVTGWTGDPGRLVDYTVRFTRPLAVPDTADGTLLTVTGTVAEKRPDRTVRVDLAATADGVRVLGAARAVVRLD